MTRSWTGVDGFYLSRMGSASVGTNAQPVHTRPLLLPGLVPDDPAAPARRRLRRLDRERDAVGELEFQRRQLRRRAERLERVRARTRAAMAARQGRQQSADELPFEELTEGGRA